MKVIEKLPNETIDENVIANPNEKTIAIQTDPYIESSNEGTIVVSDSSSDVVLVDPFNLKFDAAGNIIPVQTTGKVPDIEAELEDVWLQDLDASSSNVNENVSYFENVTKQPLENVQPGTVYYEKVTFPDDYPSDMDLNEESNPSDSDENSPRKAKGVKRSGGYKRKAKMSKKKFYDENVPFITHDENDPYVITMLDKLEKLTGNRPYETSVCFIYDINDTEKLNHFEQTISQSDMIFGYDTEGCSFNRSRKMWNTTNENVYDYCAYNIPVNMPNENGPFIRLIQISDVYGNCYVFDLLSLYKRQVREKDPIEVEKLNETDLMWYVPKALKNFVRNIEIVKIVHDLGCEKSMMKFTWGIVLRSAIDLKKSVNQSLANVAKQVLRYSMDKSARDASTTPGIDGIWNELRINYKLNEKVIEYSAFDPYITLLCYLGMLIIADPEINYDNVLRWTKASKPFGNYNSSMSLEIPEDLLKQYEKVTEKVTEKVIENVIENVTSDEVENIKNFQQNVVEMVANVMKTNIPFYPPAGDWATAVDNEGRKTPEKVFIPHAENVKSHPVNEENLLSPSPSMQSIASIELPENVFIPDNPIANAFINNSEYLKMLIWFVESHYDIRDNVYKKLSSHDVKFFLENRCLRKRKSRRNMIIYPTHAPKWIPTIVLYWYKCVEMKIPPLFVFNIGKNVFGGKITVNNENVPVPENIEGKWMMCEIPEHLSSNCEGNKTDYPGGSGFRIFVGVERGCTVLGTGDELNLDLRQRKSAAENLRDTNETYPSDSEPEEHEEDDFGDENADEIQYDADGNIVPKMSNFDVNSVLNVGLPKIVQWVKLTRKCQWVKLTRKCLWVKLTRKCLWVKLTRKCLLPVFPLEIWMKLCV